MIRTTSLATCHRSPLNTFSRSPNPAGTYTVRTLIVQASCNIAPKELPSGFRLKDGVSLPAPFSGGRDLKPYIEALPGWGCAEAGKPRIWSYCETDGDVPYEIRYDEDCFEAFQCSVPPEAFPAGYAKHPVLNFLPGTNEFPVTTGERIEQFADRWNADTKRFLKKATAICDVPEHRIYRIEIEESEASCAKFVIPADSHVVAKDGQSCSVIAGDESDGYITLSPGEHCDLECNLSTSGEPRRIKCPVDRDHTALKRRNRSRADKGLADGGQLQTQGELPLCRVVPTGDDPVYIQRRCSHGCEPNGCQVTGQCDSDKCITGFMYDDSGKNRCEACAQGCATCTEPRGCSICATGWRLVPEGNGNTGSCSPCGIGCKSCNGSSCLTCG